jgi:hypothetical protein
MLCMWALASSGSSHGLLRWGGNGAMVRLDVAGRHTQLEFLFLHQGSGAKNKADPSCAAVWPRHLPAPQAPMCTPCTAALLLLLMPFCSELLLACYPGSTTVLPALCIRR